MLDHPSLTCIDLSNSDCIHNRNRVCDEGFFAIAEGIFKSQYSLISELHLQSCFLTGASLNAMSMLSRCDLQVLNLADNDLGNESTSCLQHIAKSLVVLNLANTKMSVKGAFELAKCLEQACRLI